MFKKQVLPIVLVVLIIGGFYYVLNHQNSLVSKPMIVEREVKVLSEAPSISDSNALINSLDIYRLREPMVNTDKGIITTDRVKTIIPHILIETFLTSLTDLTEFEYTESTVVRTIKVEDSLVEDLIVTTFQINENDMHNRFSVILNASDSALLSYIQITNFSTPDLESWLRLDPMFNEMKIIESTLKDHVESISLKVDDKEYYAASIKQTEFKGYIVIDSKYQNQVINLNPSLRD